VTDGGTEGGGTPLLLGFYYSSFSCLSFISQDFLLCFSLISHRPFLFNLVAKNSYSPVLPSINLICCFVIFSDVIYFSSFIVYGYYFVTIKFQVLLSPAIPHPLL
jgi:hypothetical protein